MVLVIKLWYEFYHNSIWLILLSYHKKQFQSLDFVVINFKNDAISNCMCMYDKIFMLKMLRAKSKLHFREISIVLEEYFIFCFPYKTSKSYRNLICTLCLLLQSGCQYVYVWTTDVLENVFLELKVADVWISLPKILGQQWHSVHEPWK